MKKMIVGASQNSGTTFYRVTKSDLANSNICKNIWVRFLLDEFDLNEIFEIPVWEGIALPSELYLMVSDSEPIYVGENEVMPEDALEDYPIDDLSEYIEDTTPLDLINMRITDSELMLGTFDIEELAINLLGRYDLQTIVDDAYALNIITK